MEPQVLIDALKKSLKLKGITYSKLAEMLEISEATVRRIFSLKSFSLDRFLKICNLIGLSFQDLAQLEERTENKIQFYYTKEQEEFLSKPKNRNYLLFFENLNYRMSLEEVIEGFGISEGHLIKILAVLEKIGLVEWLPGNKFKKVSPYPIMWNQHGPLMKSLVKEILDDFMEPFREGLEDFIRMDMFYMSQESRKKWEDKLDEITLEMKKEMYREQILNIPHDPTAVVFALRRYMPKILKDFDFSDF